MRDVRSNGVRQIGPSQNGRTGNSNLGRGVIMSSLIPSDRGTSRGNCGSNTVSTTVGKRILADRVGHGGDSFAPRGNINLGINCASRVGVFKSLYISEDNISRDAVIEVDAVVNGIVSLNGISFPVGTTLLHGVGLNLIPSELGEVSLEIGVL